MNPDFLILRLRNVVQSASQSGWMKAFYIVVLTDQAEMTPVQISEGVDVPGFSTPVVQQHLDAIDLAIEAGVLTKRSEITVDTEPPNDAFDAYYTGIGRDTRYTSIKGNEAIRALAEEAGVGPTKALDIAKNPRALGIAFRGSDKAQQAILDSLEHVPDALLQRLTVKAYGVMSDRADGAHRVRQAHMREMAEGEAPVKRISPECAVVVNGSVFVLDTPHEADRFRATYQEVHGRPAQRMIDVLVNRDDAWASVREFREAQVGPLDTADWQEFIDSLA